MRHADACYNKNTPPKHAWQVEIITVLSPAASPVTPAVHTHTKTHIHMGKKRKTNKTQNKWSTKWSRRDECDTPMHVTTKTHDQNTPGKLT